MTFQHISCVLNLLATLRFHDNLDNCGPHIDPWGTPEFKLIHTNLCTAVCVNCCLRNTLMTAPSDSLNCVFLFRASLARTLHYHLGICFLESQTNISLFFANLIFSYDLPQLDSYLIEWRGTSAAGWWAGLAVKGSGLAPGWRREWRSERSSSRPAFEVHNSQM